VGKRGSVARKEMLEFDFCEGGLRIGNFGGVGTMYVVGCRVCQRVVTIVYINDKGWAVRIFPIRTVDKLRFGVRLL
jgi:hypothetical protein